MRYTHSEVRIKIYILYILQSLIRFSIINDIQRIVTGLQNTLILFKYLDTVCRF